MTEKDIFVYKLFLSSNNSDFSLLFCFFCKNCNHLKKIIPLFSCNPTLKVEFLLNHPSFRESLVGGSTPLPAAERGVHTMYLQKAKVGRQGNYSNEEKEGGRN